MGWLARLFERPPAPARAALARDERLAAWATTTDGEAVLATTRGLRLPDTSLLPWHAIHKATWDQSALRIVPGVEVEPGVVADGPAIAFGLLEPRNLPPEVRARVTRSVAHSSYHRLPGGGVRVLARRIAGQDGLSWVLRFDDAVDRADLAVREAAQGYLDAARAEAFADGEGSAFGAAPGDGAAPDGDASGGEASGGEASGGQASGGQASGGSEAPDRPLPA